MEQLHGLRRRRTTANIPAAQPLRERTGVHRVHGFVQQAGAPQLAQDRRDTAGPVHVLHQVVPVGRHLAQAGHRPAAFLDVLERVVQLRLTCGSQQVQHGVGAAAHRDVHRHRVVERVAAGDRARQHPRVVLVVVAAAQLHHRGAGVLVQRAARGVGRQRRAVAR